MAFITAITYNGLGGSNFSYITQQEKCKFSLFFYRYKAVNCVSGIWCIIRCIICRHRSQCSSWSNSVDDDPIVAKLSPQRLSPFNNSQFSRTIQTKYRHERRI